MKYDSTEDTLTHIRRVIDLMESMCLNLSERAGRHDDSKLEDPEKAAFDVVTPKLKSLTYGSPEYRTALKEIKPAITHHYSVNSHHPEFYSNGIYGMSLLDIIEMLCDWKAASERHDDGDIKRSLEINGGRFEISPQLQSILYNTAKELGWL